jgi:membrane-bound metal-dependent hydrolase YbcI (DUF457 family)
MLSKTHIAIVLFFALVALSYVENKIVFVVLALFFAVFPDIDSPFSKLGNKKLARVVQIFTKHRGFFHSFTFLILITIPFVIFLPVVALPLFFGYSLHLFLDCLTIEGISPFWPFKKKVSGWLRTGSFVENGVFVLFLVIDLLLLLKMFG